MKNLTKLLLLPVLIIVGMQLISSCDLLRGLDDPKELVNDFSLQVSDLHVAMESFVQKTQAFESATFGSMTIPQAKKVVDDFVVAGEQLVEIMEEIQDLQSRAGKVSTKSAAEAICNPVDFIPDIGNGISPALVKSVADLISETKGDVAIINKKYDNNEIDDNTYMTAINQLRQQKTTKAVNVGLGAVVGTGAAIGVGLIVGAPTLAAVATITVVGVGVGKTVTWFANWYSGVKSTGVAAGEYMLTGKTSVGGKLPIHLIGQGATVTIAVEGYAPVVMKNFALPAAGSNKKIDINPVKLGDAAAGGTAEVCTSVEPYTSTNCADISFVTATPYPADPGPGQGVTVTATVIPIVAGCSISFHIIGTDGYSKSENKTTNASGQATFYIPGGAANVFDKVTITTSNGKSYLVTYTF